MRFENKNIVVTGAAAGMGKERITRHPENLCRGYFQQGRRRGDDR